MSSTNDSDSNITIFTKPDRSQMTKNELIKYYASIKKTLVYAASGFSTIHPAIHCMGHSYRGSMTHEEKELLINTAFTEHGMPKDIGNAIKWLRQNPDKCVYFRHRELLQTYGYGLNSHKPVPLVCCIMIGDLFDLFRLHFL